MCKFVELTEYRAGRRTPLCLCFKYTQTTWACVRFWLENHLVSLKPVNEHRQVAETIVRLRQQGRPVPATREAILCLARDTRETRLRATISPVLLTLELTKSKEASASKHEHEHEYEHQHETEKCGKQEQQQQQQPKQRMIHNPFKSGSTWIAFRASDLEKHGGKFTECPVLYDDVEVNSPIFGDDLLVLTLRPAPKHIPYVFHRQVQRQSLIPPDIVRLANLQVYGDTESKSEDQRLQALIDYTAATFLPPPSIALADWRAGWSWLHPSHFLDRPAAMTGQMIDNSGKTVEFFDICSDTTAVQKKYLPKPTGIPRTHLEVVASAAEADFYDPETKVFFCKTGCAPLPAHVQLPCPLAARQTVTKVEVEAAATTATAAEDHNYYLMQTTNNRIDDEWCRVVIVGSAGWVADSRGEEDRDDESQSDQD